MIDSLPFDLGDYAPSAVSAIAAGALGHDPLAAFHRQLERERGQNRYDEAVHPTARTAGKVAGTVAQLAVPGMAWSRLVSARRMAQAAPILLKESGALAGVGAAAGVGMQVADDVIQQRRSSFPDYMGSGIGGGVGALTAIYRGPGYAGGVTGGTTSLAQDLLKGRVRSTADMSAAIDRAADAAAADNLFSLPVGAAIARGVNGLSVKKKGKLGEFLSIQRSRLRGKKVEGTHIKMPVKGGYTVADHVEKNGDIVEAKFGYSHRGLSRRQKQASHQFRNYRVDHLTPRDVAVASEVPIGFLSHQIYDDDR